MTYFNDYLNNKYTQTSSVKSLEENGSFIYAMAAFLTAFISTSAVVGHYTGLNAKFFYAPMLIGLIFSRLFSNGFRINKYALYLAILLFTTSIFGVVFVEDIFGAFIPVFLVVSFFFVTVLKRSEILRFVSWSSNFFLILIFFALVALLFDQILQISPIGEFPNRDGRANIIFWGTVTNSTIMGVPRSAGIYDEPGAFSFFIVSVIALRILFKLPDAKTLLLAFGGLVTFSAAHFVFIVFLLFYMMQKKRKMFFGLVVITSVLYLFFITFLSGDNVFSALLLRFIDPQDPKSVLLRLHLLVDAFSFIGNDYSFLVGYMGACGVNFRSCLVFDGFYVRENPLWPMVSSGILFSWAYYVILAYLFWHSLSRKNFALFGFSLMLLQRPYVFHWGYSFLILIIVWVVWKWSFGPKIVEK